jgi:uncharacterized protein (DUF1330 family)
MPAYVIADVHVTDPAQYEEYRKRVPAAVAKFQGKFLARGGTHVVLEGEWNPARVVVIEFPSLALARQWYDSPEYKHARDARAGAAIMKLVAVEGA